MKCHRTDCQERLTAYQTTYCSFECRKRDILRWNTNIAAYRASRVNREQYNREWEARMDEARLHIEA